MGTFFAYILKSALCLAAYYLFYKLLMSRDTFHRFNRFALVTLLLCSMALPLLQFNLKTTPEVAGSAEIELSGLAMVEAVTEVETPLWTKLIAVLILVYLLGIVFFALRTLVSYLSLWRMIRRCEERPLPQAFAQSKARLMVTKDSVSPFSWMRYVVVNEQDLQENERAILMHELGHIANHHTLDLILTEVCLIMQWFNPAIWLLREELQAIHEYEADEAVLNGGVNAREYQLLLIKKAAGSRLQSITNSLHQSSIKKRITMMQKKKSNPWARAKYAIAVPVAALSVALFATPTASALSAEISGCKVSDLFSVDQENPAENLDEVKTVCEVEPEFPGGGKEMMNFIAETMRYPKECADNNIEGRVTMSFIIEKDGSVSTIEEVRSPHPLLTEEAKRLLAAMPKWTPGMQDGEAVRVKYFLPVTFRLSNDSAEKKVKESHPHFLFLVDGKPVLASDLDLKSFPSGSIELVQIFKDDATINKYKDQYPDAKNGVVAITTKKNS